MLDEAAFKPLGEWRWLQFQALFQVSGPRLSKGQRLGFMQQLAGHNRGVQVVQQHLLAACDASLPLPTRCGAATRHPA